MAKQKSAFAESSLRWDRRGNWVRVAIVTALLCGTLFPVYFLVVNSLKSRGEATVNLLLPPLQGVRFDNWLAVLDDVTMPAMNSLIIVLGATAILLIVITPCAYAFTWHRFPGKEKLFTFAILTTLMPSVLTFVPLFILIRDLGLLNTKWAVIIPGAAGGIAVSLFLLRSFFSALPVELIEAARIDGASELQILRKVVLPLSTPSLVTVAVLSISSVWNLYLWPLVTLTTEQERMATVAATFFAGNPLMAGNFPILLSAYLISSLPLILLMGLLLKYFMTGATQGALKG